MKRRDFVKSALAASAAVMANAQAAESSNSMSREFYELRQYHLRRGPKTKLFDDYFREAALPAYKRLGIGPIGVFNVMFGPDSPTTYVLLPYKSMDAFYAAHRQLEEDKEYLKAGAPFLNDQPTEPAFIRMESSFMQAFAGIPKLEIPKAAAENKPRIFELRIYESHSRRANLKKVEMFNEGEIEIFRRTGLQPVFFGETFIGSKLPNLTYMLTFENMAARDKNWATFIADPEWKKLSTTPGYTDAEIVSNISNLFLRPAAYSEI